MSNPLNPTKQKILDYIRAELAKNPNRKFYLDEPFANQMNDFHQELVELTAGGYIGGYNDLNKGGGAAGYLGVPHLGYTITVK